MFGGKREKALEEELAAAREQSERRAELLRRITSQRDEVLEQFAQLASSRAQMERDAAQTGEQMQQLMDLARESADAAGDIHNDIMGAHNGLGTFDVNHSVFVGQVKKQNEKVVEIVESNKHFTTPMKYIQGLPASLREENQGYERRAGRMADCAKSMGVLSLNAAIEAGRMGAAGEAFVAAAEEVRQCAEGYERDAKEMKKELAAAKERISSLEDQVRRLNELLKENNISMGKLYKDCMQSMASYEAQQIDIRGILTDRAIGKADGLQQAEKECSKIEERIKLRMGDLEDEIAVQQKCADALEAIFRELDQAAAELA